ncbi:DUF2254 domain-containing protein [Pontivivens nitratireducens]|uniref:DUF2254 domain-containing protein n=1 Tax=Pontivivens nitratireducens TaxID=2758038 RepID=A0A6G7VJY4_9RHOB|nr:DUF2254 domain-containing protein [Pontibrevibacter nitratireducens]QIK40175.1 DUF2254 domain-containing protein [Pontibrevibacter nitratireducens]
MQPTALISKLLQDVRASYWFIPGLLVLAAVALAELMQHLDRGALAQMLPVSLRDTQAEGARAMLSVIAQSVIGVAGVMFSMTVVAVSFASSNFGPRLIGNFMRDRANQVSLGIMIATFVYTMLILRAVQDPSAEGADLTVDLFVPHLAVLVAIGLALISVVTMIFFVHHIPEAINLANITSGLGERLVAALHASGEPFEDVYEIMPEGLPVQYLTAGGSGYMRTLNAVRLSRLSLDQGWWIEVLEVPGAFLDDDRNVLRIHGGPALNDDLIRELRGCFALGRERSEDQNMMFMIDQLCEVIARALSPGINDPFTAMNCMNWMHVALLLALKEPPGHRGSAYERVLVPVMTFTQLLQAGHSISRPYVATDLNATIHVLKLLCVLANRVPDGPRRAAVLEERDELLEMALALQSDPGSQRIIRRAAAE